MTQDEIIRMAREAGALVFHSNFYGNSVDFNLEQLERFFNLAFAAGAAHEREACAKVCEEEAQSWFSGYDEEITSAKMCAAAIRARGEK